MKFYQEFAKVERVVKSCSTLEHYKVAKNMVKAMSEKYKYYDLVDISEHGGWRKSEQGMMLIKLIMHCDIEMMKLNKPMGE